MKFLQGAHGKKIRNSFLGKERWSPGSRETLPSRGAVEEDDYGKNLKSEGEGNDRKVMFVEEEFPATGRKQKPWQEHKRGANSPALGKGRDQRRSRRIGAHSNDGRE